jgi:hypothetical protein
MLLLVAALLFNLTIVGLFALSTARSGFYRAIDLERRVQATYLAEAGLNLAMLRLTSLGSLTALPLPYTVLPSTLSGDGSYSATLLNNAGDPGGAADSDGLLVLQVTGLSQGQARRRTIDAWILTTSGPFYPPGVIGMGQGVTGTFTGNSAVSGFDATTTGLATTAISFQSSGQTVSTAGSSSVKGRPDYDWAASAWSTGSGASATAQRLIDTLSASSSAVHVSGTLSGTLGTSSAPAITVIDAGATASASQVTGVGVLIVRGRLRIMGQVAFTGLVLVEGTGGYLSMAGNASITGGLFVTPPSPLPTTPRDAFNVTGNSRITWSRSSLEATSALLPSLRLLSYVVRN